VIAHGSLDTRSGCEFADVVQFGEVSFGAVSYCRFGIREPARLGDGLSAVDPLVSEQTVEPASKPISTLNESYRVAARALSFRLVKPDDDHEALLDLVAAGHAESRFGYIPFSRDKARRLLEQALAGGSRHLVAVAEVRGWPQGFVFASVGEYHIGTGVLIVTINAIYTAQSLRASLLGGRAALGLFRAVGQWSRRIGAREILLHATSGIEVDRVRLTIGQMGFEATGGSYVALAN
jgi:hypothetical protein